MSAFLFDSNGRGRWGVSNHGNENFSARFGTFCVGDSALFLSAIINSMKNLTVNPSYKIALSALIAALYAGLTAALAPVSFGPVQFRVAEALTLLPFFVPEAVPGPFVGWLPFNLLGGFGVAGCRARQRGYACGGLADFADAECVACGRAARRRQRRCRRRLSCASYGYAGFAFGRLHSVQPVGDMLRHRRAACALWEPLARAGRLPARTMNFFTVGRLVI